jgi:uncharacterized membrane protein
MKKSLVAGILLALSFSSMAFADSLGVTYSMVQDNGVGAVNKGVWELNGSHDLISNVALTGKGILINSHNLDGYGVGLEVGSKVKYFSTADKSTWNPWVQPALTYTDRETGVSSLGYVVDGGVDFLVGDFTLTPAASYSNSFRSSDNSSKYTAGVTVAYPLTASLELNGRVRHEWNDTGLDSNRVYGGVAYKF